MSTPTNGRAADPDPLEPIAVDGEVPAAALRTRPDTWCADHDQLDDVYREAVRHRLLGLELEELLATLRRQFPCVGAVEIEECARAALRLSAADAENYLRRNPLGGLEDDSLTAADDTPTDRTDVSMADRLVKRHGNDARYTPGRGWLRWDGARWIECRLGEEMQLAIETVSAMKEEVGEEIEKLSKAHLKAMKANDQETSKALTIELKEADRRLRGALKYENVSRLKAMVELMRSAPSIAVAEDHFDCDPWLLNCRNGTVDLRTGQLRAHRREDMLTKMAGADFNPAADCSLWLQTLAEVFDGPDVGDIVDYVQRAAGYSATGITREEVFFLLWGEGRNGKGTIIEPIQAALGSYAKTAPMDLFLDQKHNSSKRFTIADMVGARMLVASEAGAGQAFDLALLKNWTGGDKRSAEQKYKNPFEYAPTDKPWLLLNDKPKVKSWDTAFEERLHLIPFEHSFTANPTPGAKAKAVDKSLKTRLREELPSILAWIVEGCLEWQRIGLDPPDRVRAAIADYRRESTRADEFIETSLVHIRRSVMTLLQSDIFARYRRWSQDRGFPLVAECRFGAFLVRAGFTRERQKRGQAVLNCAWKADAPTEHAAREQ